MFFRKKVKIVAQPTVNTLFVQTGNGDAVPVTMEKLKKMYDTGTIQHGDYVRSHDQWLPVEKVLGLNGADEPAPAPDTANNLDAEVPTDDAPYCAQECESATLNDRRINCPHCWHNFGIRSALYISKHSELLGDPVLGPDAELRFLPQSFNLQGHAIDSHGMVCQDIACPRCHLRIPTALVDINACVFSIVGAPSCGKSYFLTAMIWQLRNVLLRKFNYILTDTDEKLNAIINSYESILFLNNQTEETVALPKTEIQGNNFSSQIFLDDMRIDLPIPFIFTISPIVDDDSSTAKMRNLIVYDNAGEQFEPGRDSASNPATAHLIHSDGIIFFFDMLMDARLISRCDKNDPQIAHVGRGTNQLIILNEMISRIRKYAGLKSFQKYGKPLIVVVPKYDVWRQSFPVNIEEEKYIHCSAKSLKNRIDIGVIMNVSWQLRTILVDVVPEFVATCEAFSSTVIFIPVSAIGHIPEYDAATDMIGVKPQSIKPIWVEVPALVQLAYSGVIDAVDNMPEPDCLVDDFSFNANSMVCRIPGESDRMVLPLSYCGRTVYSDKIKDYIKFPDLPDNNGTESGVADDAFWEE